MTRTLIGAVLILAFGFVRGDLRAQSSSGRVGSGPEAGGAPAGAAPVDAERAGEVVRLEGRRAIVCGRLIREPASPGQGATSPFPDLVIARGRRFRLDPTPYPGLGAYLDRLPADLSPLVHVEGTREEKADSSDPGDDAPPIAVTLFQPLDRWQEMGVRPSEADKAKVAAIARVGGLVITLPSDYPLFDAYRGVLERAGLVVRDKSKDGKDLGCRKNGYLFAEVRPGAAPDPRLIAVLELDRHVRIYPFRNVKDIGEVPQPDAFAKVREIAAARGVAVVVPSGDEAAYDAIAMGLTKAGFAVRESPVQREAGNIFATMRAGSPDLKYIQMLALNPSLKVFPFKNHSARIPPGEGGGPGESSSSTPPLQGQGSSVHPR